MMASVGVISAGTFTHVEAYLRHLSAAGWDVHWFMITPGPRYFPGVTVHRCYGSISRRLAGKLDFFLCGRRVRRLIERVHPDVLWAHYASSAGLVALMSGFRPYAVTLHGSDLIDRSRSAIGRAVLRRVLGGASLINPVCQHMMPILKRLRAPLDKVLVFPFGIELARFPFNPREGERGGPLRLLCTRSLNSPVYDIPTILRGLAEARKRGLDATLTLGAGGMLQPELVALADELGVRGVVEFLGGYNNDLLPGLFASHDVYVSASLWDGASVSLMEAMACGIFPVVTDIPANREWLDHNHNRMLFEPGNWRLLAEQLLALRSWGERLDQAVLENRAIVEARADRARNMQRLSDRLAEMAKVAPGGSECSPGPGK